MKKLTDSKFNRLLSVFLFLVFSFIGFEGFGQARFVENKGQWPDQIEYQLKVANADVFFEKDRLTWNFINPELLGTHDHSDVHHPSEFDGHAYQVEFVGANPDVVVNGERKYDDHINYLKGNDPSKWASGVKPYRQTTYEDIYYGIDIHYYQKEKHLKYDILVDAGVDPSQFKMRYSGTDDIRLKDGKLIIINTFNTVTESIPETYQVIDGKRRNVKCEFVLQGEEVSFNFPDGYDESEQLIIDPYVVFSSYTGSTADNFGFTAANNINAELYGGGIVFDAGYPFVTGSYSSTFEGGGTDIGISRFSADGTNLLYSTYIGGNGVEAPHSMIINSLGQLVVLGSTASDNFPMLGNSYDDDFNGGSNQTVPGSGMTYTNGADIIVFVFNEDGSALAGSTYLGGTSNDGLNMNVSLAFNYGDEFRGEVIVDGQDNVYIASNTLSTDMPIVGGIDNSLGGEQDGFVAKFNSDLSSLTWSTYIGGSNADASYSLKLAQNGTVYISGGTVSSDLNVPATGLFPTFNGGQSDGYLLGLSNDGSTLLAGTYLGTSEYDQSYFIEVDDDQDVYVVGQSIGSYPVSAIYSETGSHQFIQKMNPELTTSIYSTVFGSNSNTINISPTAFLVDTCERVYVGGWGGSTNQIGNTNDMTTTPAAFQETTDGSDFYFIVLKEDASGVEYATYFGGDGIAEHVDGGTSRFDKNGVIYEAVCAGCGSSDDFPTQQGVWSEVNGSTNCNLGVIKLNMDVSGIEVEINSGANQEGCTPFTVQFDSDTVNTINFMWDFGDGTTSTEADPEHTYAIAGVYQVVLTGENFGLCGAESFTDTAFATITVNESLIIANAGPDTTSCSGASVVLGDPAVPDVTYTWSPSDGLNLTGVAQPQASPTDPTTYILNTIDINGCEDADTVVVDVFAIAALGDTALCAGEEAQLFVNGGSSWAWSPSGSLSDPLSQNPVSTATSTTTYTVQSDNGAGCSAVDQVTVTVNPLPIANAGTDVSVCEGEEVQLSAGGGTTYSWSPASGLNDPEVSDPLASPIIDTEYSVLVTDINGCQDTDAVLVETIPPPLVIASPDESICVGDIVQLGVTGALTYDWFPLTGLVDPNDQPLASPINSITYYVVGEDANGCTNTDSVLVEVFRITAGPDTTLCIGDSAQVFVSGGETYSWSPVDGVSDPTSQSPFVYSGESTEFTVAVISDLGCEDNATVTLTPLSNPEPDFETSALPSCDGVEMTFTNLSQNADSFYWDFGDGSVESTTNPVHYFPVGNGPVVYLVAYNNDGLCNDTLHLDLSAEQFGQDTLSVRFGNVITPNYDGLNDCFKPHFSGVYSDCYELVVYNRWGVLQFESVAGQEHCWDGRNKAGVRVTKGTYYFIARINDFEKAGWVEVVVN